jgi:hypothetical protein
MSSDDYQASITKTRSKHFASSETLGEAKLYTRQNTIAMTWKTEMLNALDNELLHDVRLVGTDHCEVPCSKVVLAIRSSIFQKMFFGDFRERNSDLVCLNYSSIVLKLIVRYYYSNDIDLGIFLDRESLTDEQAMLLVQLRDAANYFEIPELFDHVSSEIGLCVFHRDEVECVCSILSELAMRAVEGGSFWDVFIELIKAKPERCLLPKRCSEANKGAIMCSPRLLRKILEEVDDSFLAVRCLQQWFDQEKYTQLDIEGGYRVDETEKQGLWEFAKRVNLKMLTPAQLSQIKPCSIFTIEQLYTAFVFNGFSQLKINSPAARMSPERLKGKTMVYVSGAGVNCLNGFYEQKGQRFTKKGKYGDLLCDFCIARRRYGWSISIYPEDEMVSWIHMYKAPLPTAKYTKKKNINIPFTFWTCLDGKAPAPYVVAIDYSNQATTLQSSQS